MFIEYGNVTHTYSLDFSTEMNWSLDGLGDTFEDLKKVCVELTIACSMSLARDEVTCFVRLHRSNKTRNDIWCKELQVV
jgi:hypothetical protein